MHYKDLNISEGVCKNCKYWQDNILLKSDDGGVFCRLKKEYTDPLYSCSHFMPKSTFDNLQDPNKFDKWILF